MKRLVSLCICLLLILPCFGTALAKGKTEVTECEAVDKIFDTIFYAADTMPKYVHPSSYYSDDTLMLNEEYCVSYEITFLSGDEGLRNAFEVYETTVENYVNGKKESTTQAFGINVQVYHMITPGEATFLVSLESASYTYKQEKTLHVVPYVPYEKDLIVNPEEPIEVKLSVNEYFSYDFTKYLTISEGAGRPHCTLRDENWNFIGYYNFIYHKDELPDQHLKFERNGRSGAIKTYFDAEGTYNYILMVEFDNTIGYDVPITFIVYPAASKVTVKPAKANLYLNGGKLTLTGSIKPSSIPASVLTWSVSPAGIVKMKDNGDGTVTLKPLKAGKVTVTAKESGGKSAKTIITVGEAVSSVKVTIKGKAKPGATLKPTAKLQPSKALDKKVVWSIDVGDDIATINSETGELKIKKTAPEGTVIHVTATATGAPEPVTGTLKVKVVK